MPRVRHRSDVHVLASFTLLGALFVACASARDSGALEPRFVAVHNALTAMGLAQVGAIQQGSLAEGQTTRLSLDLPAGCVTVAAIGGTGVRDVDATLFDSRGAPLAHDTTAEPQAVLRPCLESADTYVLAVKLAAGTPRSVSRVAPRPPDPTAEPQAVLRPCLESAATYVLAVKLAAGAGSWVAAAWAGGLPSPAKYAALARPGD